MHYRYIFFDLDHTLWDYETNAQEALEEIFHSFQLREKGVIDLSLFCNRFKEINYKLWDLYDRDLITSATIRSERFKQVLQPFNITSESLLTQLTNEYLRICPTKGALMPHAIETLEYLSSRYSLTIVTNGFEEIQHIKLKSSKVDHFFNHLITVQKSGYRKPAKQMFDFAMQINSAHPHEVIMVGDNLVADVTGAHNACIDAVYYNPSSIIHSETVKYEIKALNELCFIL